MSISLTSPLFIPFLISEPTFEKKREECQLSRQFQRAKNERSSNSIKEAVSTFKSGKSQIEGLSIEKVSEGLFQKILHLKSPRNLVNCAPIAEVSDAIFNRDRFYTSSILNNSMSFELYPSPSASLASFSFSVLAPSTITINENELSDLSTDHHSLIESDGSKIDSLEAEVLVKLLKEARSQVMNSVDINNKSKKLLDSLIKIVVNEFYTIPEERDRFTELVSMKSRIPFTCFLVWILAALLFFFFNAEPQLSSIGALPT